MNIEIRLEQERDYRIVEEITREAFGICMYPDATNICWRII